MPIPILFEVFDNFYLRTSRSLAMPLDGTPFLVVTDLYGKPESMVMRCIDSALTRWRPIVDEWQIHEDGLENPLYVYTLDRVAPFRTTTEHWCFIHPEYPKAYAFSCSLQEVLPLYLESLKDAYPMP